MEYREWLKGQIKNANESAEKYAKEKEFSTAYMYLAKVTAFEECLAELEKENKQAKAVSFNDLEVGKRYVGVYITGGKSMVFAVTAKDCDDEGQYIWYGDTMEDTISFKGYACEYETIEYFEEVQ